MKYQEATRIKKTVHSVVLALLSVLWVIRCDVAAPHEPVLLPVGNVSACPGSGPAVSMLPKNGSTPRAMERLASRTKR